jgi:hypothetical protein
MSTRRCGKGKRYRKTYTRRGTRIRGRCIRSQTRKRESTRNKLRRMRTRMTKRFRGYRRNARTLKKCPRGYILRNAYVRYTKRGNHTLVPQSCIKDVGAPGKGPATGPGIGPLRKGELAIFGYMNVTSLSTADRHSALKKAVKEYGSLTVWRKLNAIHIYTRRTSPTSSKIFKEDMNWIKSTFGIKAF